MTQPVLNETMGEGVMLETLMQYDRMEVMDGVLQEKPMTGFTHVHIIANIVDMIRPFVKKHRLGFFWGDGLTCILHEDKNKKIRVSRLPDSCFIRAENMPQFDHDKPFPGTPTLVVEVASPKETNAELLANVTDYLKYGSEQVWILYPKTLQVVQYFSDEKAPRIYKQGDTLTDESLFPGLTISVSDIFDV